MARLCLTRRMLDSFPTEEVRLGAIVLRESSLYATSLTLKPMSRLVPPRIRRRAWCCHYLAMS